MWDDPWAAPVSPRCLVKLNEKNTRSDHWLKQELAQSRRRMEHNIRRLHRETRHILVDATPSVRSRSYSPNKRDSTAAFRSHESRRDPELVAGHEVTKRLSQSLRLPRLVQRPCQRSSLTPGSLSNCTKLTVPRSTSRSSPNTVVWSPPGSSTRSSPSCSKLDPLRSPPRTSPNTVVWSPPGSSTRSSPSCSKLDPLRSPPRTSPNKGSKVVVLPSPPWSSPNPFSDSSALSCQKKPRSYLNRSKLGNLPSISRSQSTRSKLTALPSPPGTSTNCLNLASSLMTPWSLPTSSNLAVLPSIQRFSSNTKTSPHPSASPSSRCLVSEQMRHRGPSHLAIPNLSPRNVLKKSRPEPQTRRLSREPHPARKLQIQNCSVIQRHSSNQPALKPYYAKHKPIIKSEEKNIISKRAQSIPLILITEASEIIIPTTEETENEEGDSDDSSEFSDLSQMDGDSESFPYSKRFRSYSEPSSPSYTHPLPSPSMAEGPTGADVTPCQEHSGAEEAKSVSVCKRCRSNSVSVPYFAHLKYSARRDSLLKKYTARPGLSNRTTQKIQELISDNVEDRRTKTVSDKEWKDLKKCRYLRMPSYDKDNVNETSLDLDEIFSHNAD